MSAEASSAADKREPVVSVIIANYNYAEFLGAAIDSALALEWPHVEVIVVDDGSTDASREVMARYGGRIKAIYQENTGQRGAYNNGFAQSRGDVVIFLDSDDMLHPALVRELAAVWRPGVSKVQFQMQTIDADGRPLGTYLPQYHVKPTPERIRKWAMSAGTYPTPPGSGNAYARAFLERIFPLDGSCGEWTDTYCILAAPFFGDVVTVAKPLIGYRIHDRNDGAMSSFDVTRLARTVSRGRKSFAYAQRMAALGGFKLDANSLNHSLQFLDYRIASLRLSPQVRTETGDSISSALVDTVRAVGIPQGLSIPARLAILVWTLLVAVLPETLARTLVIWRFIPSRRPKFLRLSLDRLKVARYGVADDPVN